MIASCKESNFDFFSAFVNDSDLTHMSDTEDVPVTRTLEVGFYIYMVLFWGYFGLIRLGRRNYGILEKRNKKALNSFGPNDGRKHWCLIGLH